MENLSNLDTFYIDRIVVQFILLNFTSMWLKDWYHEYVHIITRC